MCLTLRFCRSLACVLVVASPVTALAQAPQKLGYQGRLLDPTGKPVTGTTTIGFALYDSLTSTSSLWSEAQSLMLSDGYYATFLGDATPSGCADVGCTGIPTSVFDGRELYLQLTVNGSVLQPRQRVASVAYAMRSDIAQTARNLEGGTVNATSVSINGTVIIDSTGHITTSTSGGFVTGAGLVLDAGVVMADFGSGAAQVCRGNDPRLSDARTPTGTASGDLLGTYPAPFVVALRGRALSNAVPTAGQVLSYNGTAWQPSTLPLATATTGGVVQPGAALDVTGGVLSVRLGYDGGTALPGDAVIVNQTLLSVGPTGLFTTPQAALAWLDKKVLRAQVVLVLQPGTHTLTTPIDFHHPDGRNIAVLGDETTPANVVLNFATGGGSDGVVVSSSVLAFLTGVTLVGNAGHTAILAHQNAMVGLGNSVRISGFTNGVISATGSRIEAKGVQVVGLAGAGVCFGVNAATMDASDARATNCQYGFLADQAGSLFADRARASGFSFMGAFAGHSSHLSMVSGIINGPGASGVCAAADLAASLDVRNASFANCLVGAYAGNNGVIDARASVVDGGVGTLFSPTPGVEANNFGVVQGP